MKLSKWICLLLLPLLLQMSTQAALATESGAIVTTASEQQIQLLKNHEGFSATVYQSGGAYYIGYGQKCASDAYPNGVTESEADALLRKKLEQLGQTLQQWLRENGATVNQAQFDALLAFSYNLGSNWLSTDCSLVDILRGDMEYITELDIVNAFGVWCHAGGNVQEYLVRRRLEEACIFLYGDYAGTRVSEFSTLHLRAEGGELDSDIRYYRKGMPYGALPAATRDGYQLVAWQTEQGGILREQDIVEGGQIVHALWSALDTPFDDVVASAWYYPYVRDLCDEGILSGYDDGRFHPDDTVTFGAALKLIQLGAGYPEPEPVEGHWAAHYLAFANSNGWLYDSALDLDAPIDRLSFAKITAKALQLRGNESRIPFADTTDPEVGTLFDVGVFLGEEYENIRYFRPSSSITRAELSAIIWRIMNIDIYDGMIRYGSQWIDFLEEVPPYADQDEGLYRKSPEDDAIYYDETLATTFQGIDVSTFQGDIDWNAVRADGIDFAIIRLGFRGYGAEGSMNLDAKFEQNMKGATEAGIKVGVYFFSQAITEEEAREEAAFVLEHLNGRPLQYPVVYDWEAVGSNEARTNGLSADTLGECANVFCSTIEAAGYQSMIYMNPYVAYIKYDIRDVMRYDLWFARYKDLPDFHYDFKMWQYTEKGSVAGISGKVDRNISFIDYSKRQKR